MFFNNYALVQFGTREKPFTGFRLLEVTSCGHAVALTGKYLTFLKARQAYETYYSRIKCIIIQEENGVRVGEWKIVP